MDRVKALEELVFEIQELCERDLVSLLQVSPNYVLQLKKQVLQNGKVVEAWLDRNGPNGVEKFLLAKTHYEKLVQSEDEDVALCV